MHADARALAMRKSVEKRPDAISRELLNLIGDMPSVAPTTMPTAYKERPDFGRKAVRWHRKPFRNEARTDGLQLRHWAKEDEPEGAYAFARLNEPVEVVEYTDAEYQIHLEDPGWTREETDYLFSLCRQYNLRFLVVHDRYAFSANETRSLEDLKERYYNVTKTIMFARNPLADPKQKAEIAMLTYDKSKELQRKQYVARLASRTWAEIQEEERLLVEVRRIEQQRRRLERDRDNLVRLLSSENYGQPTMVQILAGEGSVPGGGAGGKKKSSSSASSKKKRPDGSASASPMPSIKEAPTPTAVPQKSTKKSEEAPKKDKKVSGVFVRSQTITPVKSTAVQLKVNAIFDELALLPKMPTERVCQQYDALLQSVLTLLEVKKQTDKLEQELRVLRARKAILTGEQTSPTSSVAGEAGASGSSRKRTLVSPAPTRAESKRVRRTPH